MSYGTSVAAQALTRTATHQARDQAFPRNASGVRGGSVAKEDRGFASMDRSKQREIASKGGKAAHQKGTAHEWTSEEAREAGRKGGMASHRRKQQTEEASGAQNDEGMMGGDIVS